MPGVCFKIICLNKTKNLEHRKELGKCISLVQLWDDGQWALIILFSLACVKKFIIQSLKIYVSHILNIWYVPGDVLNVLCLLMYSTIFT